MDVEDSLKDGSNNDQDLRPFLALWTGQAFSLIGSQLVQFALIWWMTQQTGKATVLATATIIGIVPQVILGPFAGVFVDRWNRRVVMLAADFVVALATAFLAYLFWSGSIQLWHVYVALFFRSLGSAFHWPAMTASISLMVPPEQLTRIQGLNQILQGGINIASAPLGAMLITLLPLQGVMMIDLATAAIAMTIVLIIKIPQPTRKDDAEASLDGVSEYLADLWAGLRYLVEWRGLFYLALTGMVLNMVLAPTTSFMPLLVTDYFKGTAWHLGVLEAGFAIGILIGGLALSVWGGFRKRIHTSMLGVAGIGVGILLVGLTPASLFPLAVAGMSTSGVMSSLTNGPIMAIFQLKVEPIMQGRVLTLINSMTLGMMPLSLAATGPLVDVIGVRTWFVIGGVATLVMAFLCTLIPSMMNIEEASQPGGPPQGLATTASYGEIEGD